MTKINKNYKRKKPNSECLDVTLDKTMLNWSAIFQETILSFQPATDAWQVKNFHFLTWMKLNEVEIMEIAMVNFYRGIFPPFHSVTSG